MKKEWYWAPMGDEEKKKKSGTEKEWYWDPKGDEEKPEDVKSLTRTGTRVNITGCPKDRRLWKHGRSMVEAW